WPVPPARRNWQEYDSPAASERPPGPPRSLRRGVPPRRPTAAVPCPVYGTPLSAADVRTAMPLPDRLSRDCAAGPASSSAGNRQLEQDSARRRVPTGLTPGAVG